MTTKVLILGGGISGLSLGWKLAEKGVSVEVLEAKESVGGLAATVRMDGHSMDYGPHSLFSEDPRILNTIRTLFDGGISAGVRDVRLYMSGKYLRYPLNAEDIILKLGAWPSARCFVSFLLTKMSKAPHYGSRGPTMEQWSRRQFGRGLHELFFKPYTEQFWDVKCSELSPDCIPSYKHMSFTRTLKLLVTPRKRRENVSIVDREMLPLYYPREGFGAIADRVAQRLTSAGGSIHTGLRASEARRLKGGGFLVKARNREGEEREFEADYVVSTIPISRFARMITPKIPHEAYEAAQALKYLSLLVLYVATDKRKLLNCMYEYCLEKPYNRITDVNNFTLVPDAQRTGNMLSIEQSCHMGDRWWKQSKEELFKRYLPHLEEEGILKESDVTALYLLKAPYAYPMYLYNYKESLSIFRKFIATEPNLRICGRIGAFRYMDIDQCMKLAFGLADEMARTISEKQRTQRGKKSAS